MLDRNEGELSAHAVHGTVGVRTNGGQGDSNPNRATKGRGDGICTDARVPQHPQDSSTETLSVEVIPCLLHPHLIQETSESTHTRCPRMQKAKPCHHKHNSFGILHFRTLAWWAAQTDGEARQKVCKNERVVPVCCHELHCRGVKQTKAFLSLPTACQILDSSEP